MSLTYSLNQPGQSLSRTTAIALIVLIHATALIAFNNGIGRFFKPNLPHDMTVIDVKPDPKPEKPVVVPEMPPAMLDRTFKPAVVDPGPIVINISPDHVDPPPVDTGVIVDTKVTETVMPPPVKVGVLNRVDPAYPARAEAAGQQGTVLLDVQIDQRGNVMQVSVAQSSGFDELDAAAVKAVKHWHFTAVASGAHVRVPIKFQLNSQKY